MANTLNPQSYTNMISALNTFAVNTEKTTQEIYAACTASAQVLGENDVTAQNVVKNANNVAVRYAELASVAREIASLMEEELNEYYEKSKKIWQDDVDADDDY